MRVGTSKQDSPQKSRRKDHPHACGDKCGRCRACKARVGSSPCVWGQVAVIVRLNLYLRIIPMRVGTRTPLPPQVHGNRDHPHACGDKHFHHLRSLVSVGSSPCVWGQDTTKDGKTTKKRIIPMRVGTSRPVSVNEPFELDHPHACGDKLISDLSEEGFSGSSPCVWGQDG